MKPQNNKTLILEKEELLLYDSITGNIKVDKQIFDVFVPNAYIEISFSDNNPDVVYEYIMISEDKDGIFMKQI